MTLASLSNTPFQPDALIAGHLPLLSEKGSLLEDETAVRGSVLGKVTIDAAASAAKSGGNTGNGTFVLDATTPILAGARSGIYTLRVIDVPTTHGSIWELVGPDGVSLGNPVVAGSGGTKTVANQIKGVLTDGGTDWIVGDGFDITITAGAGVYRVATSAAVDGSAVPCGIAAHAADAVGGDVDVLVYTRGDFNAAALDFGTGHDADSVREALRAVGIYLVTVQES